MPGVRIAAATAALLLAGAGGAAPPQTAPAPPGMPETAFAPMPRIYRDGCI